MCLEYVMCHNVLTIRMRSKTQYTHLEVRFMACNTAVSQVPQKGQAALQKNIVFQHNQTWSKAWLKESESVFFKAWWSEAVKEIHYIQYD